MNKIYKSNNKATVCANNVCATVHGETAKFVNAIVVFTLLVVATAVVIKVTK